MILTDFRKSIEKLINESGLSIDCVYFVMKDVLNEVTEIYNDIQRQEIEAKTQEELKKQEQEDKEETEDKAD